MSPERIGKEDTQPKPEPSAERLFERREYLQYLQRSSGTSREDVIAAERLVAGTEDEAAKGIDNDPYEKN